MPLRRKPKQKKSLRNVTATGRPQEEDGAERGERRSPEACKYGPSPRVLRGQNAVGSAPTAEDWDGRVRQLQERFHDSPRKAIVDALAHTNGHAGKAARLLRSQWSPSALRTVAPGAASTLTKQECDEGSDDDSECEGEDDDLASQAGRSIAAASASLQHALTAWADSTDTSLHTAVALDKPHDRSQQRDVAVQSDAALAHEQEEDRRRAEWEERWVKRLHEQARQMITEQQRLETELDSLRKRSDQEREELRREHKDEVEAWQQKAAALQAEVVTLQQARRQQRKVQRRQHREMASLVRNAATRADEASVQLRSRRDRLELQAGRMQGGVDSDASEHPTDYCENDASNHGEGDGDTDDDVDVNKLAQPQALAAEDHPAVVDSSSSSTSKQEAQVQWSSGEEDSQIRYKSRVESSQPEQLQKCESKPASVPPGPSPPQLRAAMDPSGNVEGHRNWNEAAATPRVAPNAAVLRAGSATRHAAETPAFEQRRRDRRRFLEATEGLPGGTVHVLWTDNVLHTANAATACRHV